ncbi:hypothetical protein [Demequina subtropica]|uniref:hypothetical protein n=1 Tax=Demequina subtropica TaxID=1638989 RepID=UPI000785D9F2|nr:hypothetical protein [Demequina subtropica]
MDSVVLEIAIGLVLVFAIAAAAASAVNEIITRSFNVRSKALWARLDELLSGTDHRLGVRFLWKGLCFRSVRPTHENPAVELTSAPDAEAGAPPVQEAHGAAGAKPAGPRGRAAKIEAGLIAWEEKVVARRDKRSDEQKAEDDSRAAVAQGRLSTLARTGAIGGLDYVELGNPSKVSQIPGKVFANALLELAQARKGDGLEARVMDLAKEYQQPDQKLLAPLGAFLATTGAAVAHDTDKLLAAAETWFDGQMEVLSNTYKRNTKWALGAIGVVIAILFNVNAIAIAGGLNDNAAFRQAAVTAADGVSAGEFPACIEEDATSSAAADSESGDDGTSDPYAEVGCAVQQFRVFSEAGVIVPGDADYFTLFGDAWNGAQDHAEVAAKVEAGDSTQPRQMNLLGQIVGVMLTGLATALGGPFWFDLMKQLTGLRKGK